MIVTTSYNFSFSVYFAVYLDKADFHYVYACAKDLHSILSNTEIYSSEFLSPKRHLVATIHVGIVRNFS